MRKIIGNSPHKLQREKVEKRVLITAGENHPENGKKTTADGKFFYSGSN